MHTVNILDGSDVLKNWKRNQVSEVELLFLRPLHLVLSPEGFAVQIILDGRGVKAYFYPAFRRNIVYAILTALFQSTKQDLSWCMAPRKNALGSWITA